jgi:hypothetical protein
MGQGEKLPPRGRELTAWSGFASIELQPKYVLFGRRSVVTEHLFFVMASPGAHASSWWYDGSRNTGEGHLPA